MKIKILFLFAVIFCANINGQVATSISSSDTRSINHLPNSRNSGVYFDFKSNTTDGLSDLHDYHGVMTFKPYGINTDFTGGFTHQLAFTLGGNLWMRSGASTSWSSWSKMYNDLNLNKSTIDFNAKKLFLSDALHLKNIKMLDNDGTSSYLLSNGATYFQNMGTTTATITPSGNVGIGTTAPTEKLHVNGDVLANNFKGLATKASDLYHSLYYAHNGNVNLNTINAQGKFTAFALPLNVPNIFPAKNNANAVISIDMYDGAPIYAAQLGFNSDSEIYYRKGIGSWNKVIQQSTPTLLINTTIDNGIDKLQVNGKILAEEVTVVANVLPDYVFQKYYTGKSTLKADYQLPTLAELESYTKENHHLPNVPSAAEVKEKGLQLGGMSNLLLQKIEELTLYIIEQNKINAEQQKEIELLKKAVGK